MRKLARVAVSLILAALAGLPLTVAFAQNTSGQAFPQKFLYASDYGVWQIKGQTANTYTFFPISICTVPTPSQGSFFPFATNAPIFIQDATPANSELLTPSAVTPSSANPSSSQCGVSITAANQHYSFQIVSGTAGLQEALNQVPSTILYPVQVVLDRNWYQAVASITGQNPGAAIYNAAGTANAILVDQTTAPYTFYSWNGTHYTPSASNQTVPTLAVTGAGAGTGPSATSIVGTGTSGTVGFTTGTTPTASAAVFTLTWPAVASGGFQYAPACTFTTVGAHLYSTGVASSVIGPPAVATFTSSASALAASTAYVFKYTCR